MPPPLEIEIARVAEIKPRLALDILD